MKNALADYLKKFNTSEPEKQRPQSAFYTKRTTKITAKTSTNRMKTNHSNYYQSISTSNRLKSSHRAISLTQRQNEGRSVYNFQSYHKKSGEFRYQIINSRCMKKLTLAHSGYSLNIQQKKPILGQGIKIESRAQRKQFLSKRLKCLRKNKKRRVMTQTDPFSQNSFSIKGIKVL